MKRKCNALKPITATALKLPSKYLILRNGRKYSIMNIAEAWTCAIYIEETPSEYKRIADFPIIEISCSDGQAWIKEDPLWLFLHACCRLEIRTWTGLNSTFISILPAHSIHGSVAASNARNIVRPKRQTKHSKTIKHAEYIILPP